jgi:tRNA U34 5-methylaminomethyl-2-thiouridine-forming methyltransferase MnmC
MALIVTQDGSHSVYSEQYGVTYHSRYGAVTESLHVFIQAGLRYKAAVQPRLAVLEVGLGTGLNAFLTWIEAERRNLTVRYTALESAPLSLEEAEVFNYPEHLGLPERRPDFCRLHYCAWERAVRLSAHFWLRKKRMPVQAYRPVQAFDLIYFDAFAPTAQPEMWTEAILRAMYRALRPEGILVTYCAKGQVKRALRAVGFEVESLPGPPGKREMTRAWK